MLEAKFEQAQLLKRIIEAIRDLVKECNVEFSENGIGIQALDESHIALISMELGADAFSSYRCDRNVTLGINISSLDKVLKCGNNEDVLTLQADDKPDSLSIVFEDQTQDRISEFSLKLMDIDQEHLSVPESDYPAQITVPTVEFQRICRNFANLSESMTISATKEGVQFKSEGDIGSGNITVKPYNDLENAEKSTTLNVSEPVVASFNLKYLMNICRGAGLSSQVTMQLDSEIPLEVEYKLPSGHLRYYLAPKISDGADE